VYGRSETLLTSAEMAARSDFRLGASLVSPSARTITGPSGSMTVEPRVMQVLVVLAEAAGAVVTRDKLLQRCWGGVYVGDDSLNRAIAGVRRISSGVGGRSFEIETIPRTGYRLIAPPDAAAVAIADEEYRSDSASPPNGKVPRRLLLGGGLAAAAGGIAFWISRPPPPDPAARLIEESRIKLRSGTPETAREAIALLERAVALSPDNADAWGLLALTRARAEEHAVDKAASPAAAVDQAARRALQLDGGNADAKAALATAIPYYGDWLTAERRFDAVLAQHPGHLWTRDSRAFLLGAVGRMREAGRERLAMADAALFDADLQFKHVYGLWFLGRITEADRAASRALEMWPRQAGIWFARLWLLASTGRLDRALAHIQDEAARPKLPAPMFGTLQAAISAAKSRRPAEIEAATERVMGGVTRSVTAVVNGMMLLNLMGATDRAFELARAYYLEQGPIIAAMQWRPGQPVVPDQRRRKTNMLFTPTAAGMQRDPRFLPLMREMGLTDYWNRRGVVPDFLAATRA
jgi:DNA-binding winged helix-turn-helix (wHTH) protein/tetratricopeptide (TPR) repeat protein